MTRLYLLRRVHYSTTRIRTIQSATNITQPMASEAIDLTRDSADKGPSTENPSLTTKSTPISPSRQPMKTVQNGSRPSDEWTGAVDGVLLKALLSLSEGRLRQEILGLASLSRENHEHLRSRLTVPGKYAESESEDCSGEESTSDSEDDEDGASHRIDSNPVALGDDKMTPRYAQCENCSGEFDVTCNDMGDCVWHPGEYLHRETGSLI